MTKIPPIFLAYKIRMVVSLNQPMKHENNCYLFCFIILQKEDIQKVVLEEVLLKLLGSEDGRVRAAAGEALVQ